MDQCILVRSYTRDVEDDVDDEMINKAKVWTVTFLDLRCRVGIGEKQ